MYGDTPPTCYHQFQSINLAFVCPFAKDLHPGYQQDDPDGVRTAYGLEDNDPLVENLGSVVTKEGRCLAFPNIYQHCVAPFRLEDPTRAGVRRILVFFLVDPGY